MAGLQTIVDNTSSLLINRRKVVGLQYTRNEIPRATLTPTTQPWKFVLTLPNSLRYSLNRDLLEAVDTLDRYTPQVITFNNNPMVQWIFAYQGTMSASMISAITVTSFSGNQLVLGNLPVLASGKLLFAANDLIQIGNNPYPFTSTTDVLRGTDTTVTITTNRPNIISSNVIGEGITVGAGCQFNVFCANMPTYKLIPGGYLINSGSVTNNAYLEWSDSFQFYEWTGSA
jgi:hypothetical protein